MTPGSVNVVACRANGIEMKNTAIGLQYFSVHQSQMDVFPTSECMFAVTHCGARIRTFTSSPLLSLMSHENKLFSSLITSHHTSATNNTCLSRICYHYPASQRHPAAPEHFAEKSLVPAWNIAVSQPWLDFAAFIAFRQWFCYFGNSHRLAWPFRSLPAHLASTANHIGPRQGTCTTPSSGIDVAITYHRFTLSFEAATAHIYTSLSSVHSLC